MGKDTYRAMTKCCGGQGQSYAACFLPDWFNATCCGRKIQLPITVFWTYGLRLFWGLRWDDFVVGNCDCFCHTASALRETCLPPRNLWSSMCQAHNLQTKRLWRTGKHGLSHISFNREDWEHRFWSVSTAGSFFMALTYGSRSRWAQQPQWLNLRRHSFFGIKNSFKVLISHSLIRRSNTWNRKGTSGWNW